MILSRVVKMAAGKLEKRPAEAPQNLMDIVLTLAEAMRFGYAETLGTWHVSDLPRAIVYALIDKGRKTAASECGERSDCVQVKDPEMLKELCELKKCLRLTMLFSKKGFRSVLYAAGFVKEDVLLRRRTAGLLKPAFTVIRDKESKCLFVFIRGTQSLRDTLTDAIGAPISFNHYICSDGEMKRNNMVSGHGHRGMVAAASWIRNLCTPILLGALRQCPDFQIKIVGHSLGGGTAALLTFMLREIKQFSSSASVSLELAEFGKPFIISVINDSDIVPTLSAYSVHNFVFEGQIKHKKLLNAARSSIIAVGSHLPFVSTVKAIADRGTQVVTKNKQRTRLLLPWSRRENTVTLSNSEPDNLVEASRPLEKESTTDEDESKWSSEGSDHEEEQLISTTCGGNITASSTFCDISDEELLNQLEELQPEKQDNIPNIHVMEKQEATTKDITEEENQVVHTEESADAVTILENVNRHPLYPPGRIIHIVPAPENSNSNHYDSDEKNLYLYETPKLLYGRLRLSRRMILDHMTDKYLKKLQQLINQLDN